MQSCRLRFATAFYRFYTTDIFPFVSRLTPVSGYSTTNSPESTPQEIAAVRYSAESEIRNPAKLFADMWSDTWDGRELAWRLFLRNIRGLYRQTLLGLFWAFLPPVANTAIWIFLRQQGVFSIGDVQVNETLYILTGMILWQVFSDAIQMPMKVLNQHKSMLSKLRFSRESLLLVGLGEIVFDLLIRAVLLVLAMAWFGVAPTVAVFGGVLAIIMLIALGATLGILLMPIGSLYQDVGRLLAMVVPFWMILTPIIYPPATSFPGTLLNWLNPASPFLILARDLLLLGSSNMWGVAFVWALITVPLALFGLVVFRISIPVLVERMNT